CPTGLAYSNMAKSKHEAPHATADGKSCGDFPQNLERSRERGVRLTDRRVRANRCCGTDCKIFHLDNPFSAAIMRLPSLRARPGSYSFSLQCVQTAGRTKNQLLLTS